MFCVDECCVHKCFVHECCVHECFVLTSVLCSTQTMRGSDVNTPGRKWGAILIGGGPPCGGEGNPEGGRDGGG